MVKILLFLFSVTFISQKSFSEISPIVSCLALQEQAYHKSKNIGPMYKLNQELLNLLAIENKLKFQNQFTQKICDSKNQAYSLLKHLLLDHSKIFVPPKEDINEWELTFFTNQISQLIKKNYQVFLNFLSFIQMEIKSPKCLHQLFPGYEDYLSREKYLKDVKAQYNDRESLSLISILLNSLSDIEALKLKCAKR